MNKSEITLTIKKHANKLFLILTIFTILYQLILISYKNQIEFISLYNIDLIIYVAFSCALTVNFIQNVIIDIYLKKEK
jgi:hypothetical protein